MTPTLTTKLPAIKTVTNQFGTLHLDLSNTIILPHGLIGISDAYKFVLLPCPIAKFQDFMLLQSIDYDDLVIMVLPIAIDNNYYARDELVATCQMLNIAAEDAIVAVVVATKVIDGTKRLIANMKAPIFIDSKYQVGAQYVLANNDHEIQKIL